jgi:hypothetical protein
MIFVVSKTSIMGKSSRLPMHRILRMITMCYILLIIPAALVYSGMYLFTDMRGKELFNSFLPVALILLVLYIYYLIRPGRLLGTSPREWTKMLDHNEESDLEKEAPTSHSVNQTDRDDTD